MEKRGELAVGELVTAVLAVATLALGMFLIRGLHQKQTAIATTGTNSGLLQSYEAFVTGELKEGGRIAIYPKAITAKEGENPFFVLGIRNDGPGREFIINAGSENFVYNNRPFQLGDNEIRIFIVDISTKGIKGSKPYTISALNSENIYATSEILVNVE